jgi:transmembrane sensor
MSGKRPHDDQDIAEAAADFVVNGEEPEGADDQKLVAWLTESPRNVAEYMRMNALWEALADPNLETGNAQRPSRNRHWWVAAAAAMVLAVSVAWWLNARPHVHSTAVGEVTSFALADRSVVFLNAASRIAVDYSDTQRRIVLHAGEAVFDVAPDRERPFIVVSGSTRVTALGTTFAVARRTDQTTVTLIEGRVVVRAREADRDTVALSPGQSLTADSAGTTKMATVDPQQVAPWRLRKLIFESEPLREVAAAFNRFNRTSIAIDDPALRELRISGVFAANDPESLLAYLRTLDRVAVEIRSDGSAVVRLRGR